MALPPTQQTLLEKTTAQVKGLAGQPLSGLSLLGLLLWEEGWILRAKGQGKLPLRDFYQGSVLVVRIKSCECCVLSRFSHVRPFATP